MTQPWGQSVVYQRDYPGLHSPFSAHNVGLNIRKRLVNLLWSLLQARTMLIVPALPSANLLPFRFCSCYISDSFVLTVSLCSFYVNGCYFKSNKWRERKRGLNCVALLQLRIWRWACCRATASETPRLPLLCRLDLNNEVFSLFSADGPPVVGHYDISDTDSDQESMSVETVRPTVIKHELKTHRGQDLAAHSGCIRALSSISGQLQTQQTDNFHYCQWSQGIFEVRGVLTEHHPLREECSLCFLSSIEAKESTFAILSSTVCVVASPCSAATFPSLCSPLQTLRKAWNSERSARPLALSLPLSRLFQVTRRRSCRTMKTLISRATSTSLPLTARWK